MAYRNPAQQGSQIPFDVRVKVSAVTALHGMNKDVDPGGIPPDFHQHLENVQFKGGIIVPRGGQRKLFGTPLNGAIDAIWEASDVGAGSLLTLAATSAATELGYPTCVDANTGHTIGDAIPTSVYNLRSLRTKAGLELFNSADLARQFRLDDLANSYFPGALDYDADIPLSGVPYTFLLPDTTRLLIGRGNRVFAMPKLYSDFALAMLVFTPTGGIFPTSMVKFGSSYYFIYYSRVPDTSFTINIGVWDGAHATNFTVAKSFKFVLGGGTTIPPSGSPSLFDVQGTYRAKLHVIGGDLYMTCAGSQSYGRWDRSNRQVYNPTYLYGDSTAGYRNGFPYVVQRNGGAWTLIPLPHPQAEFVDVDGMKISQRSACCDMVDYGGVPYFRVFYTKPSAGLPYPTLQRMMFSVSIGICKIVGGAVVLVKPGMGTPVLVDGANLYYTVQTSEYTQETLYPGGVIVNQGAYNEGDVHLPLLLGKYNGVTWNDYFSSSMPRCCTGGDNLSGIQGVMLWKRINMVKHGTEYYIIGDPCPQECYPRLASDGDRTDLADVTSFATTRFFGAGFPYVIPAAYTYEMLRTTGGDPSLVWEAVGHNRFYSPSINHDETCLMAGPIAVF